MGRANLLGEYLRARRALVAPETAGFPVDRHRRVVGLRREEVAELAGISPEYYVRLEQGRDHLPSAQVLDAIATALQLDAVARSYLGRVARPDVARADGVPPIREDLGTVRSLLSQWTHTAAFVTDRNLDVVYANALADELGGGSMSVGSNRLSALFDPVVRASTPDWEGTVARMVGALRLSSDPADARLQQLVGTLSMRSSEFRRSWARQDVGVTQHGTCTIPVDPFGPTEFSWQDFAVPGHDGCTTTAVFATPGTPAARVLAYLAVRTARATDVTRSGAPDSVRAAGLLASSG